MAATEVTWELPFGFSAAALQFPSAVKSATIVASTAVFTSTAHGAVAGDRIVFATIVTTTGISLVTYYYIIASGLAANTFKISATLGGSSVALTTDGSATFKILKEPRLRMANKITSNSDEKTTNYEGDNIIVKLINTLSVGFKFDSDALTIGAHELAFSLTEVTAGWQDSYTSGVGLFTSAERTGISCGFWGEATQTSTDANGLQTSQTVRYWYPVMLLTAAKPPELQTADKPGAWAYNLIATNMSPTVDIMGVALPVTGAPMIRMTK